MATTVKRFYIFFKKCNFIADSNKNIFKISYLIKVKKIGENYAVSEVVL